MPRIGELQYISPAMSLMAAYDSGRGNRRREEDRESRTGPPISRPNIRPLALIVLSGCDCRGPLARRFQRRTDVNTRE
ncbi:hypothetical protein MTP99_009245 [Tenebrio molitor]|nr:hypothetical protein MTP99_009245 [Tenebrio molitor]